MIASSCWGPLTETTGATTRGRLSSHESATVAGSTPSSCATRSSAAMTRRPRRFRYREASAAVLSREEARREGEPRQHADIELGRHASEVALVLVAMHEVVVLLQRHHVRDAELPGGDARLEQALAGVVAAAEVAHVTGADELVDGEERLLEGHPGVVDVQEEQVDAIDAQSAQRRLDGGPDGRGRQPRMIGALADLGGQGDGVAIAAAAHPVADHDLAAPTGVRVGGVDEGAAELDVAIEHRGRGRPVGRPAEHGAAQRDRVDLQRARPEAAGQHHGRGRDRGGSAAGGLAVVHGRGCSR